MSNIRIPIATHADNTGVPCLAKGKNESPGHQSIGNNVHKGDS